MTHQLLRSWIYSNNFRIHKIYLNWYYLNRLRTSKVNGLYLNTKQLENMVSSYFWITKKPQASWDNPSAVIANNNNIIIIPCLKNNFMYNARSFDVSSYLLHHSTEAHLMARIVRILPRSPIFVYSCLPLLSPVFPLCPIIYPQDVSFCCMTSFLHHRDFRAGSRLFMHAISIFLFFIHSHVLLRFHWFPLLSSG